MKTLKLKIDVLAAIMSGKPTVISTFCGTGGSSLGYKWAGFEELLAIDWEPHAVECFRLNFPDVPCWERDMTTVTAKEILDFCKIKSGELDVFDGSPPCQGFSTVGKRKVNDPRNRLFEAYVQLVNDLQPKVFVMENVPGMAKGKMKGKFIEIMKALKSLNYNVKAKQMNAMYYGVPQSRERIIFIGVRNDLDIDPFFPEPSKNVITAGEALVGITPDFYCELTDVYGRLWPKVGIGKSAFDVIGKGRNSCVKLNPNEPSCTLLKMQGGRGFATVVHWKEKRSLAINEAKRLCSFPDDWQLPGKYREAWARLGNAVMPKFMQAIAETIKDQILFKMKVNHEKL